MIARLARSVPTSSSALSLRGLSSIRRIGTDDPRSSAIVVHGSTVYLTGQVDATGADVAEQTQNCLDKIDALLAQAGTDKSKLLSAMIWLKDIETDFKAMNEVWNGWVDGDNKPVRACVEAKLAREVLLVEVQCVAAAGDSS